MGLSVALRATGVIDFVEVRTPCIGLPLYLVANVMIKSRTAAE